MLFGKFKLLFPDLSSGLVWRGLDVKLDGGTEAPALESSILLDFELPHKLHVLSCLHYRR